MISTWSDPSGPEIYTQIKVRFTNALEFLEKASKETGKKVTVTHLVCRSVGEAVKYFPELNGKLMFGNFVPFDTIDVSCLVALEEGKDLGFICFKDIDHKDLATIYDETQKKVGSIRGKEGEERKIHEKVSAPFKLIPTCVGAIIMETFSWLGGSIGLDLPMFNLKRHPFGCATVTNVGTFNVETIYGPFPPVERIAMLVVISSTRDEAIVVDGQIVVEKVLTMTVTFDNRFIDGHRAAKAASKMKEVLERPGDFLKIS
ncbi:unnamed protein product [Blepharisma stoltei]|uniref:2-oxoacid dehydrogenase acyltransferase catalytic domain-containing protein n=1 Tax=Blepharisma stoltei TaxID=1481888 RepID=A0AAU9JNP3_9CILI|nr:unnamed protein product [Blepharisma stoltei]